MPVQINEMIVRANVVEPGHSVPGGPSVAGKAQTKEDLIRECTEAVLEILKRQNER